MDTSIQKRKPLAIDFDLHTDGDDEFKRELVTLMIDNIEELQESLKQSTKQNSIQLFRDCCHKITPTINILDDKQFTEAIESIKHQEDSSRREQAIARLLTLCSDVVAELRDEIK